MHSRELPLVGNAKKPSKKKQKKRGGWVLLDGFCTCTWALIFFFQRPSLPGLGNPRPSLRPGQWHLIRRCPLAASSARPNTAMTGSHARESTWWSAEAGAKYRQPAAGPGAGPVSLPPNWGAGRNGEQLKWRVVEKEWAFVLGLHGYRAEW
jgi:hypothetical protein